MCTTSLKVSYEDRKKKSSIDKYQAKEGSYK